MRNALAIFILLPTIATAQDSLTFKSGKEFKCEILSYDNGSFSVKLADGTIKQAAIQQVKNIAFAPNAVPLESSPAESGKIKPQAAQEGFRKTQWGMSAAEVISSEESKPIKEDTDAVMFKDRISGLDTFILYIFVQNRLVRAKYIFTDKHTNKNDYIDDFKNIKGVLAQKYGRPSEDNVLWRNDLYKDDHDEWGMAICVGHLMYAAKWETPGTSIINLLYGENYEVTHIVEYSSKALAGLEESEKKKAVMEKI